MALYAALILYTGNHICIHVSAPKVVVGRTNWLNERVCEPLSISGFKNVIQLTKCNPSHGMCCHLLSLILLTSRFSMPKVILLINYLQPSFPDLTVEFEILETLAINFVLDSHIQIYCTSDLYFLIYNINDTHYFGQRELRFDY